MLKPIVYKGLVFAKFGGLVAKLSLVFTAVSTIATVFDTIQTEMGGAIDAVCVAIYVVAKSFSVYSYDKTQHIPPVLNKKKSYPFTASRVQGSLD